MKNHPKIVVLLDGPGRVRKLLLVREGADVRLLHPRAHLRRPFPELRVKIKCGGSRLNPSPLPASVRFDPPNSGVGGASPPSAARSVVRVRVAHLLELNAECIHRVRGLADMRA